MSRRICRIEGGVQRSIFSLIAAIAIVSVAAGKEEELEETSASDQGTLMAGAEMVRPNLDEKGAAQLARRLWGVSGKSIVRLNGYDDKNFWIRVSHCSTGSASVTAFL